MNASKASKKTIATVTAVLAARVSNPSKLLVDPKTPGLAGVLVLFRAPNERPTPAKLRDAFEAALGRASSSIKASVGTTRTPQEVIDATTAHNDGSNTFLASLPDVVTPVAALGVAVRVARTESSEWVHNGQREGHSRWTYCDSHVQREGGARILGDADSCAEVKPDGTLTIDSGVPADIADTLRSTYDKARGVIEPARIKGLVASHFAKCGGRAITDDTYLMPDVSTVNVGVLAGLIDLGGWGTTVAVADPERIAALASPVTKSIEEQIADVIADTQAFISRAKAATDPTSTDMMRESVSETISERIETARQAAALWRDRLKLASLDVDAELQKLEKEVDAEADKALAAVEARRAARKAAKEAEKIATSDLKAIDEEQDAEERRAAKGSAQ